MVNIDLAQFVEIARKMVREGVVIAPWLTWGTGQHRIPEHLLKDIDLRATQFATRFWRPDWKIDLAGGFSITKERAAEAYHEAVSGTAVYLSHLELGTLRVTEEMVSVADRLTENFVKKVGPERFVTFYLLTIIYENLQALNYYDSLHTDDFLTGDFHRPWGTDTLQRELEAALAARSVEVRDGLIRLTPRGKELLQSISQVFVESGFLKFRSRLIRLNNFNNLDDAEAIMEILFPVAFERRKWLVEMSQIQPGMSVLELGCGTGALTFEAGLFQAVGPSGRLVATDPSTSMLATVRRKRDESNADWVEVVRATAERLPFPDNTFDMVTGNAFLHLTNIDEALKEIARVLRPGGTFTATYPLHFPVQSDFFIEWFEPLLTLESTASHPDILPGPDTVPTAMRLYFEKIHLHEFLFDVSYRSPHAAVEFLVDIGNMFEESMSTLPWRARQDLIKELIRRGEEICRKYPPEALVEKHPSQAVRAVVKK